MELLEGQVVAPYLIKSCKITIYLSIRIWMQSFSATKNWRLHSFQNSISSPTKLSPITSFQLSLCYFIGTMDEIHNHISEISDKDVSLHHHNSVLHDDKDRLNQEISEMRKEYDELLLYFVSYRAKFQEQERRSFKKLKLNDGGADEDRA